VDDPEDLLVIEGYPTVDPRFAGITVYATNVTTKNLQAAARKERAPGEGQTAVTGDVG
jgi:hypothetical protein